MNLQSILDNCELFAEETGRCTYRPSIGTILLFIDNNAYGMIEFVDCFYVPGEEDEDKTPFVVFNLVGIEDAESRSIEGLDVEVKVYREVTQ